MRTIMKWLVPVAAIAVGASPGQAQVVNFTTSGFFTTTFTTGITCTQDNVLGTASCTGGGFTLAFTPTQLESPPGGGTNVASGSSINLGAFTLTGTGNVTVPSSGLEFHLVISQTTPSVGTNGTNGDVGNLSGTVNTTDGNFSSLIWTPDMHDVTIGSTTYSLVYDATGFAADKGYAISINSAKTINANVVATPEPASMGLFATGLVGLAGFVKRRKRNEVA